MNSVGSTTSKTNQTSVTSSPQWLQDAGQNYYNTAAAAAAKPYTANPYLTQAGYTQDQTDAQQMIRDTAKNGNSTYTAANQNMTDTLNGKYLGPESNPWLESTVNTALDGVQSRIGSQFAMGGAFAGSANQEMMQKGLGETSASMYSANYENERNRQMQAAQLAPAMQQAGYTDANALNALGASEQQYNQNNINNQSLAFQNEQNYPAQQLQYLSSGLAGANSTAARSTTTNDEKSTPYFSNTTGNAIGTASAAMGLGSQIYKAFF